MVKGPAARSERGDTLIELMIAIVVMGVAMVAVIGALVSSVRASGSIKYRAQVSQVVTRVVNDVQLAPWDCVSATPLNTYQGVLSAVRPTTAWTITLTSIENWTRNPNFDVTTDPAGANPCPTEPTKQVQRLTISVSSPGDTAVQAIQVVKRP